MNEPSSIDCASYEVTDSFFGAPYVDVDEWRETPLPYRHVHGGFADCDTRFTIYFPQEKEWQGRPSCRSKGAHAGHEDSVRRCHGRPDRWTRAPRPTRWLHGRVEHGPHRRRHRSEGRGRPDDLRLARCRRDRPVLQARRGAGVRRSAASQLRMGWERWRPTIAAVPRDAPDVFDGALPFMGGGNVVPFPATEKVKSGQPIAFACMFNLQRTLAPRRQARTSSTPCSRAGVATRSTAEQPRTRRAGLPLRAGLPVRRRAHDLLPDGSDLAVDVDRRPPRRAGPDLLHRSSGPSPGTSVTTCRRRWRTTSSTSSRP